MIDVAMTAIAIKPAHFPWFDYSRCSFSLGLKTPAGVYLSGHTASEYDSVAKRIVVRGGMTEQVRTAWTKIGAILDAAGLGFENVVRVVEYLRLEGIERYVEAATAREEVFGAGNVNHLVSFSFRPFSLWMNTVESSARVM
jgi:enamine deaminase RidA (YjgF/YER057c/UK114 family)